MRSIRRSQNAAAYTPSSGVGGSIPGPPPGESRFPGAPPGGHTPGVSRGLPGGSGGYHPPPSYAPSTYDEPTYNSARSRRFERQERGQRTGHLTGQLSGQSLVSFFFWTLFLVGSAIGYLWVYNQTDVVAAQILEQQALIAQVENANRDLQVIIDQLSKIDRITDIARRELNMVSPAAESLIVYLPEINW